MLLRPYCVRLGHIGSGTVKFEMANLSFRLGPSGGRARFDYCLTSPYIFATR